MDRKEKRPRITTELNKTKQKRRFSLFVPFRRQGALSFILFAIQDPHIHLFFLCRWVQKTHHFPPFPHPHIIIIFLNALVLKKTLEDIVRNGHYVHRQVTRSARVFSFLKKCDTQDFKVHTKKKKEDERLERAAKKDLPFSRCPIDYARVSLFDSCFILLAGRGEGKED